MLKKLILISFNYFKNYIELTLSYVHNLFPIYKKANIHSILTIFVVPPGIEPGSTV